MINVRNKVSARFAAIVGSFMLASGISGVAPAIADDAPNLVIDQSVTATSSAVERESAAANLVSRINDEAGTTVVNVVADADKNEATIYFSPSADCRELGLDIAKLRLALHSYGFDDIAMVL